MALPKYLQVMESIKKEYAQSEPHSPIASEREISATLGISRMTVRKALEQLCREGYLYRDGNRGTFISSKVPQEGNKKAPEKKRVLFLDSIYDSNNVKNVQKALHLETSDRLFRLVRLVESERIPLRIEEIYAPAASASDEESGLQDYFVDLDQFRSSAHSSGVLKPVMVPDKYARLLHLRSDQPVILLEELILKKDGYPAMFVNTIYNPETSPISYEK